MNCVSIGPHCIRFLLIIIAFPLDCVKIYLRNHFHALTLFVLSLVCGAPGEIFMRIEGALSRLLNPEPSVPAVGVRCRVFIVQDLTG